MYSTGATGTVAKKTLGSSDSDRWMLGVGANFGVTKLGTLYAYNAKLTGDLTATSDGVQLTKINEDGIFFDSQKWIEDDEFVSTDAQSKIYRSSDDSWCMRNITVERASKVNIIGDSVMNASGITLYQPGWHFTPTRGEFQHLGSNGYSVSFSIDCDKGFTISYVDLNSEGNYQTHTKTVSWEKMYNHLP